jgi:hypothetical protein
MTAGGAGVDRSRMGVADWLLRGLLVVNFTLFALTFIPAFSGIGPKAGVADRWWGDYRFDGWRADVLWMCLSSVVIFAGAFRWTAAPGAWRRTSNLCRIWLACFVVYVGYVVIHMFG